MKVVVIGSGGQLGHDLMSVYSDAIGLTHSDLEVTDFKSVEAALKPIQPDIVINTAAFHKTDDCEMDPLKTFSVNAVGAWNVSKASYHLGARIAYISTDYVFDGLKGSPYTEDDAVNPVNVYGASKVAGERMTALGNSKHYLIRCSGLYGQKTSGKGHNFPDLMIRLGRERRELKVVTDEVLAPTYTKDLAEKMKQVFSHEAYGLYHIANSGGCSWFEFARQVIDYMRMDVRVVAAGPGEFPKKARRPPYSVLDCKRLRDSGFGAMRDWRSALKDYLKEKYGGAA